MPLINSFLSWIMKKRMHQIGLFIKYPHDVQNEWLRKLVKAAKDTEWGKKYGYQSIQSPADFRSRVPLQDYDSIKHFIKRLRQGERGLLWPSDIKWFAKSSGTVSDQSKFIPVSPEALEECHYKCGKDMLSFYCNNYSDTKLFTGKGLALGGSHQISQFSTDTYYGDLSAIIIQNLPFWAQFIRTPELSIALLDDLEEKISKITKATIKENVTNIAGVPSWTLVLIKYILQTTGKNNLLEVWPNLELFIHGAVNFSPYKKQFEKLIPSASMHYLETYSASEGFFGIQDRKDSEELLLMLDYGIYYEFIPMNKYNDDQPETCSLDQVELDINYAIVISTNAGLWRYIIGDTVVFTSLDPYRIKITGRTKHFMNVAGEELIIDNAENALSIACEKTDTIMKEYTAAPIYFDDHDCAAHEWLIEFDKEPDNLEYFIEVLDNALKSLNSDYEAKRYQNLALRPPVVRMMRKGTFYDWMKSRGKLGGQHKVPRLSNERKYVEDILRFVK